MRRDRAGSSTASSGRLLRGLRMILALLALAFAIQVAAALATHSNSTVGLLAIDANPEGNAANSLGPVNGCTRTEPGTDITVDYVVDAIPPDRPLIGFEAVLGYDSQLLEVTASDYRFLLASAGAYTPFSGQSDPLPDSDGSFRMQVLDTASMTEPEANVERGAGVLARVTFRAKATGLAGLSITVSRQPLTYPTLLDTQNELIFVDRTGAASLAVGQDCPVEAQQPAVTDMAEVNEQILADNPQLAGGSPGAGGSPQAGGTASPSAQEGQTAAEDGSTSAPSPTVVPCAAPPRPTPGATATPLSPTPPAPEGAPSPTDTPSPAPAPTEVICTPTPTPVAEQIASVDDNSKTPLIAGAFVLLAVGSTAAGSGWYLYRRSRAVAPGA